METQKQLTPFRKMQLELIEKYINQPKPPEMKIKPLNSITMDLLRLNR